jgi:hypothetical protein
VLGAPTAVLVFGLLALFASGGGSDVSVSGSLPALTTTTTTPTPTTVTTIVALRAIDGRKGKATIVFVSVPNVVGMTLAQATAELSAVGLGAGETNSTSKRSGQSATGTILAQFPAAGSQTQQGGMVKPTVSGY